MQGPQVDRENVRIKIALIKEIEKLSELCDEICKWRKKDGVEFLRVGSSADRYGRMEEKKKKENSTWRCEDGYYADDGDDAASLCLC